MAACALMGASAVSAQSWTEGAEPSEGEFYLYNVGGNSYLTNGSSWVTHSILDGQGTVLTVTIQDGKYRLHSGVSGGAGPYVWGDWMNNDGGTNGWYLNQVTYSGYSNVYTLQQNDAEGTFLYWNGGGEGAWGNEVYGSGAAVSETLPQNYYWLLIPKETRQNFSSATVDSPLDVTYLLNDPDFEKRVSNGNNSSPQAGSGQTSTGWTCGGFWRQYSKQTFANAIFFEKYSGSGLTTADAIYQEPELQTGVYALSATAYASCTEFYLYAGEEETHVEASGLYMVVFSVAEDNTKVQLGAKIKEGGTGNWVAFDNVRLTYYGSSATVDEVKNAALIQTYEGLRDEAEQFNTSVPMANAAKDDLQTAREQYCQNISYNEESLNEAIGALTTAINNATASVSAYAKLKAVIDKIDEAVKTTNVYDKAFFDAAKESYEAGNYSTEEASALSGDDRYKTLYTWVLAGNWFIGEKAATEANSGLYQNHWSWEGNEDGTDMKTPFMEYWTGDGNALGVNTLSTTIKGLTANETYNISMLVRVRQQNNQTKADGDITLTLNGGDPINMADGTESIYNGSNFYYKTVQATADADEEGKIAIAININEGNHISWLAFKNLTYSNDTEALAAEFEKLKGDATKLLSENDVVTGNEKEALETAKDATPSGIKGYSAAISAIQAAINDFTAAIPSYQAFAAEKVIAEDLNISDIPSPTTAAEAAEAVNTLKVAEHNYVVETYTTDASALFIASWDKENFDALSNEHWSATTHEYFDKWSGSAFTSKIYKTVTLPEGHYAFYAAARGQADLSTATLKVTIGDETKSVPCTIKGNRGFGINTDGEADFSAESTYACNNEGFGWEWRQLTFDLDAETEVTLAIECSGKNSWVSAGDTKLLTYDNAAIIQQMVSAEVEKAKALIAANVGDGVFQIPSSAAEALQSAISAAESVTSDSEVESAIKDLQDAEEELQKAVLNAPDASQKYNIVIATPDHAKEGNAVIFALGNTGANNPTGYTLNAGAKPNANLAQAFTFTQVEGNIYNISFESAEGTTYLTYGAKNGSAAGWKDSQIQATTVADNKGEFRIAASATEGAFNIYNTITNSTIACQSGGNIYTESGNADFSLTEAEDCSITVNTEAGFGTIIVPFDVTSIPEGVTVYSCSGVNGNELNLKEEDAIEANKPYIIEGAWSETLTGDALGTALTNTVGALTGVYADQNAVADSYVMQNGTKGIGFYKVASGSEPEITANHAYLTVSAGAREAYLLGEATAIKAIEALTTGKAEIYNAAGARLQRLQKGVNIIKSGDKTVKVMVK